MLDDYEPLNDYEDQMDGVRLGLLEYDDVHCVHGTFIGNWAGPDYLCGPCEMGVTDEEWFASQARAERRARRVKALRPKLMPLIDALNAATIADPESAESKRLLNRLLRYLHWGVKSPFEISGAVADKVRAR